MGNLPAPRPSKGRYTASNPMTFMHVEPRSLLLVVLGFAASLALTPLVRGLARRCGMVPRPRADRWAKKPTALLGGLAIFAATALVAGPLLVEVEHGGLVLGACA